MGILVCAKSVVGAQADEQGQREGLEGERENRQERGIGGERRLMIVVGRFNGACVYI